MAEGEKVVIEIPPEEAVRLFTKEKKRSERHFAKGVLKAVGMGFIGFLTGYWFGTAINGTAGTTVISPVYIGLGVFATIFSWIMADAFSEDL